MANINIKTEKNSSFCEIYHVMNKMIAKGLFIGISIGEPNGYPIKQLIRLYKLKKNFPVPSLYLCLAN